MGGRLATRLRGDDGSRSTPRAAPRRSGAPSASATSVANRCSLPISIGFRPSCRTPLVTAYSVSEALGREGRVEGRPRDEPVFYGAYFAVTAVGAGIVLVPGAPLVPILFLTQAANAVLLLPLLVLMIVLAHDRSWASTPRTAARRPSWLP